MFGVTADLPNVTGFGIRVRFVQCALLVAQVEICQSPDFVIDMSNNPSYCWSSPEASHAI